MSDTHTETASPFDVPPVSLAMGPSVLPHRHVRVVPQPVQEHVEPDLTLVVLANPSPDALTSLVFGRQADGAAVELGDVLFPAKDASAQKGWALVQVMSGPVAELAFGRTLKISEAPDPNSGSFSDPDLADGLFEPPPGSS